MRRNHWLFHNKFYYERRSWLLPLTTVMKLPERRIAWTCIKQNLYGNRFQQYDKYFSCFNYLEASQAPLFHLMISLILQFSPNCSDAVECASCNSNKISNWKKIDKLNGVEKEINIIFLSSTLEYSNNARTRTHNLNAYFPRIHNDKRK